MSFWDWLWNLGQPKAVALRVDRAWPQPRILLVTAQGTLTRKRGVAVTVRGKVAGRLYETTDNGIATFAFLTLTGDPMATTLTFDSAGLTSVSADVTLTPVAAKLAFVTAPPSSAQDAKLFPASVVVQVQSSKGVAIAQAGIPVTVSASAGANIVGPTSGTTDANGRASFAIGVDDLSL